MRRIHARVFVACTVCLTSVALPRSLPTRTAASAAIQSESFELDEATIAQMQEWMAKGRYSSRQLTELYLRRIERIDRGGPELRSIAEVNPDALDIAASLDA